MSETDDDLDQIRTDEALGQSEVFLEFQERLSQVSVIDRPVLIIGERGSGKELAASRLHFLSKRWQEPLVALNCAALSPTLIESELFGHEPGAFTGAGRRRQGRFEAASGGTLFLDEIATIPVVVQGKILRVVEYGTFERVGSSTPIQVNARIVGATNANLPAMARKGKFKQDLLDRLSFEVLYVPPLRARQEDILLLANHFAARVAFEMSRSDVPEFTSESMDALQEYRWPGNVRELKNVVERSVYRSESSEIAEIIFDPFESPYAEPLTTQPEESHAPEETDAVDYEPDDSTFSFTEVTESFEKRLLKRALAEAKFNQRKAADTLGLTYHQFRGLYRKYKDDLEDEDES